MTAVREALPDERYGRSQDQRADRKLKIIGAVLGAVLLGVVVWTGVDYVGGQDISAEVIKSKIVSDDRAEVHLEVRKDRDAGGYCTLRSLSEDGGEVARKDFRFDARAERIDEVVSLRTTARATAVELMGCTADGGSRR
ncbi:DUF4307 domain-containing protein [Streptomyces fulvorobeus]|uniref:Membrane protein n=1 Tax=Streptomyces fulvorobeus TaxID=284028 RepID=A0A7J0C9K4_9ACTN|nr:DUF4307 domain-containing protein [Streptomyces fulvorobeus]NYE42631.1 hypothetical protein [Streptomyces fulvorobeus]GFM99038.1 membrane protein [Streptomyces fulvorobeus]